MARDLKEALGPTAHEHGLGELISLHAKERPLIRFRARFLWILLCGALVGLIWGMYDSDRSPAEPYVLYPDGVVLGSLALVYLGAQHR